MLCLPHHDKATAPRGLTAALTPEQIRAYKLNWESDCAQRSYRLARSRTAFYMVDYKNAERVRDLYAQLTPSDLRRAYELLSSEFGEEDALRKEQGFDFCTEPNTAWNPMTQQFVEFIKTGNPHPQFFENMRGHIRDSLLPTGFRGSMATFAYYDLWCQIMIRAILSARSAYDLTDLAQLDQPTEEGLVGKLIFFRGQVRGRVALPEQFQERPTSEIVLSVRVGSTRWRSVLELKTHYVYSMTAASALSKGTENGLLLFRGIDSVRTRGNQKSVQFSCTPLIIGNGALDIPGKLNSS